MSRLLVFGRGDCFDAARCVPWPKWPWSEARPSRPRHDDVRSARRPLASRAGAPRGRVETGPYSSGGYLPAQYATPATPSLSDDEDYVPPEAAIPAQIQALPDIQAKMKVVHRRSQLLVGKHNISRTAVADGGVVEVVQYSENELAIIGQGIGQTTVTLWFDDGSEPLIYLVEVIRDPSLDEQRRHDYGKLEKKLALMFPNSKVYLIPFSHKIIVKGQARDAEEATRILDIIRGEVITQNGGLVGPQPGNGNGGGTFYTSPASTPTAGGIRSRLGQLEPDGPVVQHDRQHVGSPRRVPGLDPRADRGTQPFGTQTDGGLVQLRRQRRRGADRLGVGGGSEHGLGGVLGGGHQRSGGCPVGERPRDVAGRTDPGLRKRTLRRIQQRGGFRGAHHGGVQGVGAVSTQFRGFGVSLVVTPTIIDKDLIRLQISPEFSELNGANSVNGIPGTNLRRVTTTVKLREGQTIALAGLFSRQTRSEIARIPFLGEIPLIGPIAFSNKRASADEKELLILATPEIVRAMEADEVPRFRVTK